MKATDHAMGARHWGRNSKMIAMERAAIECRNGSWPKVNFANAQAAPDKSMGTMLPRLLARPGSAFSKGMSTTCRVAKAHTVLQMSCPPNSSMMLSDAADIASNRGGWSKASLAYAQKVMERLCASASAIFAKDASAIASRNGWLQKRNFAKAQAVLLSSCGRASRNVRIDAAESASIRGPLKYWIRAIDQAVFARRCGLKSSIFGSEGAAIKSHRGASRKPRAAKAQAKFEQCGEVTTPLHASPSKS
mmetsp:Transcript_98629/g.318028  ORF Transcript_98629/g.318028 Transcript_98629/m.318028 type:complete len:248 (+) Transcript_98629:1435-2178(+)